MKKAKIAVALLIAFLMIFTVVLSACKKHQHEFSPEWSSNDTYHWHQATCEHTTEVSDRATHELDSNGICTVCGRNTSLNSYRSYISADLLDIRNAIGTSISASVAEQVDAAYNAGLEAIQSGNTVTAIKTAFQNAKDAMLHCVPLANGVYDYTGLSQAEKTDILGLLEAYAIRTGLTGISLYEDGAYVMYHERVTLGTENYIPGYGFGTMSEGSLSAPLTTESNTAWQWYYHSVNAQDPGTLNYLNDQGSETSDFYGYIGASYYTVFMNETKDGYDWVPELAKANPTPVGTLDASGQTDTWEFPLRTGLKYSTLGKRAAYNDREVQPEDFITPFKLLLNQKNNYFRGNELANSSGASAIAGAKAYFNATANARKGILSDAEQDFSGVGVKVYQKNGEWWFQYTLGAPVNAWYARYYISSSLYMPIPASFVEEVGVDAYLGYSSDKQFTPVDNSLSLGAYTLERWDESQQVVYKKNTNYVYSDTKYSIAGVHIRIFPASLTDTNAVFREFIEAGTIDGAGIPEDYLEQYASDPRTRTTSGTSVTKLNVNALDEETWEYYFGVDGVITNTPLNKYWQVEPALSNSHFRSALSYALNRNEIAAKLGIIASVNYFSSNYMSDPENGIAYNLTQAHRDAVAGLLTDTDSGGFSLQLAREYFKMAIDELEADGKYTRGTPSNPTVIQLEIAWQAQANVERYHKYIKQYWEEAFNDASVTYGGCYKLEVITYVPDLWSDVYYKKMMVGQFDIGFGGIEGNTQNPLNFMEVLSSDQSISGNFTLNWAVDTNDPFADALVYNGMLWSYDALLESTQQVSIVENGKLGSQITVQSSEMELDEQEENVTVTFTISWADGVTITFDEIDFVVFGFDDSTNFSDYLEWSILYDEDSGEISSYLVGGAPVIDAAKRTATFTFKIPVEDLEDVMYDETFGIDLYIGWTFRGIENETDFYNSYYYEFEAE